MTPYLNEIMVSTHAPARGQSRADLAASQTAQVSTHAPARGQSVGNSLDVTLPLGFNSCPREGAIGLKGSRKASLRGFNSCPREGAISEHTHTDSRGGKFQLMPPRGGNLCF